VTINFDKIVERRNTKSIKWDSVERDILPMWVADMDFEVPESVIQAVKKRAEHGVYGYTVPGDTYYDAIIEWWRKRYNYEIKKEWINYSPGVVPAINMLIRAFTHPGDKVILQVPVYHPFFTAVSNSGCEILENPLKLEDGRYVMDFEDLEDKLKDSKVKVMILCSPHNPVGRVWTKDELTILGSLCLKHGVIVISDEIHCDLVYKDYRHTPFTSISDAIALNSVVCTAPSKTFNLAGFQVSSIIIPNPELRKKFSDVLESNGIGTPNIFGIEAAEAAYKYGEQWLDELIDYLEGNLNFLLDYVKNNIPQIKVIRPEGTYLVWVDCKELNMNYEELHQFFLKEAKVWFNEGYIFGQEGQGFERINIACPRSILAEALNRIEKAVKNNNL
jgi:cystathionine beta-lyase